MGWVCPVSQARLAQRGSRPNFRVQLPVAETKQRRGGPKAKKKKSRKENRKPTPSSHPKKTTPTKRPEPTPEQVEARQEKRREYERKRNQTPERKERQRRVAQAWRDEAKKLGICKDCPNSTVPDQTRCETYAAKHQAYRARRTATENAAARHSGPDPLFPRMFSELNLDTPRPVTVWANEDADTTNETITMTHRVVSDDANYDGITVPDLAVTVIDNDTPQVIGVWTQPGDRQLVVNWTATDKATGYKVQWKAPGDNYNTNARMATITSGSTTSATRCRRMRRRSRSRNRNRCHPGLSTDVDEGLSPRCDESVRCA